MPGAAVPGGARKRGSGPGPHRDPPVCGATAAGSRTVD